MYLYGMHVVTLGPDDGLSGVRALPWFELDLEQVGGPPPSSTRVLWSEDSALLEAAGDLSIRVTRRPELHALVTAERWVNADELTHPLLAFVGAVAAHWTGRLAFHAAAVVLSGRAWLLMASPNGGKSTLVTGLAARGHAVLCDDLAVLDGRTVLAGPRSADLRESAAVQLGRGRLQHGSPGRERWRAALGTAPHEVPLGGIVLLEWDDRVSVRSLTGTERLRALATHDALGRGPANPTGFFDLLDVPAFALSRPRAWNGLEKSLTWIEDLGATSAR